jgi:hypothetical protein
MATMYCAPQMMYMMVPMHKIRCAALAWLRVVTMVIAMLCVWDWGAGVGGCEGVRRFESDGNGHDLIGRFETR